MESYDPEFYFWVYNQRGKKKKRRHMHSLRHYSPSPKYGNILSVCQLIVMVCICVHTRTHSHRGILLFSHKKEGNLSFATTFMDPEGTLLSEINQTHKNTIICF